MNRPSKDEYYMTMAWAVRRRADCTGRRVGAVLVRGDRVIATGYNGVPAKMLNCSGGGCERCHGPNSPGEAYDKCICVHAEANALLSAARFGIPVEGAAVYTTLAPCFTCAKAMLQAGIVEVCYAKEFKEKQCWEQQQRKIMANFKKRERLVEVANPFSDGDDG